MRRTTFAVIAATSIAALPAFAQDAAPERPVEAHYHGVADLNVVQDGPLLAIEFIAPADDIVGFEHRPESETDKATVIATLEKLRTPEDLFDLPAAAACVLHDADIESGLIPVSIADGDGPEHADKHAHEDQQADSHEHAHKKERAETHEHEHDIGGDKTRAHADFYASYEFECDAPDELASFDVRLFTAFASLETIHVQLVGPAGQNAVVLTPDMTEIVFAK